MLFLQTLKYFHLSHTESFSPLAASFIAFECLFPFFSPLCFLFSNDSRIIQETPKLGWLTLEGGTGTQLGVRERTRHLSVMVIFFFLSWAMGIWMFIVTFSVPFCISHIS